jgi:hypothetical protein
MNALSPLVFDKRGKPMTVQEHLYCAYGPNESEELAERRGLFHAASIRKEIAAALPYFAAMASGDLGDFGTLVGWRADSEIGTRAGPALAAGS